MLPLLLGLGAAIVGAGGHLSAQETNERAQEIAKEAQELYNREKEALEQAQKKAEESVLRLGYSKQNVMETSVDQFLTVYRKIKNVQLAESVGLNEISKFAIEPQDTIQLQKMADIYESALSSTVTGAAAGTIASLAVSGYLPVATGILSSAGTYLAAGEVATAIGTAGTALSFATTMTPLAAIAAPVVLFTGISSSIKADENLEKAIAMEAEAEAAVEKMKVSETMCSAIAERADMFDCLLNELDAMFSQCTQLLSGVVQSKTGLFKGKTVDVKNLTEAEIKLIAVTRSLAGAVKAVIDTPILKQDGSLSEEGQEVYEDTKERVEDFSRAVRQVKAANPNVKAVAVKPKKRKKKNSGRSHFVLSKKAATCFIVLLTIIVGFAVYGLFGFSDNGSSDEGFETAKSFEIAENDASAKNVVETEMASQNEDMKWDSMDTSELVEEELEVSEKEVVEFGRVDIENILDVQMGGLDSFCGVWSVDDGNGITFEIGVDNREYTVKFNIEKWGKQTPAYVLNQGFIVDAIPQKYVEIYSRGEFGWQKFEFVWKISEDGTFAIDKYFFKRYSDGWLEFLDPDVPPIQGESVACSLIEKKEYSTDADILKTEGWWNAKNDSQLYEIKKADDGTMLMRIASTSWNYITQYHVLVPQNDTFIVDFTQDDGLFGELVLHIDRGNLLSIDKSNIRFDAGECFFDVGGITLLTRCEAPEKEFITDITQVIP